MNIEEITLDGSKIQKMKIINHYSGREFILKEKDGSWTHGIVLDGGSSFDFYKMIIKGEEIAKNYNQISQLLLIKY